MQRKLEFMACFKEQPEKKMNSFKFLLVVAVVVCSFLWTSVDGSLSYSRKTGPSPPRNLRRSVVGVLGSRKYHVFWTASLDTGGSAVNYSVKLCINDSLEVENNSCKWSSELKCMPTNVTSTSKKFSCILNRHDFFAETGEFSNYTLCVVASNNVGNAESCISAPWIASGLATPRPPCNFSAYFDTERNSGDIRVTWIGRSGWQFLNTVYTVLYHAEKQQNKTKEVKNKTSFTVLNSLLPFTNYCIYLMVQSFSREWVRSAPSDAKGPICLKTPAGDPDNPPVVEWDRSVVFPDNAALRNVTVEWKPAKISSWRGIPHEYDIYCYQRNRDGSPGAKKREYHIDAARNRTVLQELNTADSYIVYIEMRNAEGKQSGLGKEYTIKALQVDNSTQPVGQGNLSDTEILLIIVSVLIGCAACVTLFLLSRKWRKDIEKEKLQQGDLHIRLQLDDPSGHEYTQVDSEVQHPYDHLYAEVDRENV